MLSRITVLSLVGLVSAGAFASALTMGVFQATQPVPCTRHAQPLFKAHEPFDVVITPGTKVVLAGSPSGAAKFRIWGHLEIAVRHVDGSFSNVDASAYMSPTYGCDNYGIGPTGPIDLSAAFQPGLNTVQLSLIGEWSPFSSGYYSHLDATYLVGSGGQMIVPLK